jgi:colanic acid/amylovoran biosynthesis glycosyltransferase
MRIAFLLHQFPALSETFILRQITGLIALGHDVRIYAEYAFEDGLGQPEIAKFDLLRRTTYIGAPSASGRYELPVWPFWGSVWPADTGERLPNRQRMWDCLPRAVKCLATHPRLTQEVLSSRRYGYQATSLSALYRLSALASEVQQFDVLHAHFGPVGKSFRFARRLWRAPLVVSFHGYDFSTWPLLEGPRAYAPLFDDSDLITVHSNYAEAKLRSLGCPSRLLRRLECGIDLNEFAYRDRHPDVDRPVRVLTVGRLVEKKGIDHSIRAVAQLISEGHDLRYEIVGDGPLRRPLARLAAELDIANHVVFAGPLINECVRDRMNKSDLFVLASITAANGDTEGTPVSLLEAQASGMPVVSTRHAGIPEIVLDNETGFLAPEGDPVALADALRRMLNNASSWAEMGRRGRAFVEQRHDITQLNRRLADLYQDAIARFALPSRSVRTNAPAAKPATAVVEK